MTSLPYMPFFVNDYLADTAHLTTREHGAYFLLIMNYWQRQGPLPGDDKRLAAITRLTYQEWMAVKPTIEEMFHPQSDGNANAMRWHHKRIDNELQIAEKKIRKAREAAKARWDKEKNAVALQAQCKGNAMRGDKIKEVKKEAPNGASKERTARASRLPDDWLPSEETFFWCLDELQWSRERVHDTLSYFRDYWHAEGGQRARKVDWNLTFKNWCRREGKRPKPNGSGQKSMATIAQEIADASDERGNSGASDGPLLNLSVEKH